MSESEVFITRFDLTDEEWAIVSPLLPGAGRGRKLRDDRQVLNGIFYVFRTGAPWRNLPERYGPRTTVYNRDVRWGERGVWRDFFEALAQQEPDALVFIEGSVVKAHRAAAGPKRGELAKGVGRSRPSRRMVPFACQATGGRTNKIHAAVDAKGKAPETGRIRRSAT